MRPSLDKLSDAFAKNQQQRAVPAWLSKQQGTAWQEVQKLGLPYRKDEHWKYTSLYDIAKVSFDPLVDISSTASSERSIYTNEQATCLHFINGELQNDVLNSPLPEGLKIQTVDNNDAMAKRLSTDVARPSVIQELNHAFANAPVEIVLEKDTRLDKPIYILQTLQGDQALSSPRLHVVVQRNTKMDIVEHIVSDGTDNLCNRRVSFDIGANAKVHHSTLQTANKHASNLAQTNAKVARDSHYASMYIDLGSKLARHDLGIELNGEGSHCSMLGVFLPHAGQHFDHHTLVKHNVAHTQSEQVYHGIAGHKGHGVFNGKVLVQPQAQKINAQQSNKNILLGEHANIDTKPELEIYADDVKCSHGATVGQLDETSLFYLQSRGIAVEQARLMLVRGFVSDIYQSIDCPILLAAVTHEVEQKLNALLGEHA